MHVRIGEGRPRRNDDYVVSLGRFLFREGIWDINVPVLRPVQVRAGVGVEGDRGSGDRYGGVGARAIMRCGRITVLRPVRVRIDVGVEVDRGPGDRYGARERGQSRVAGQITVLRPVRGYWWAAELGVSGPVNR